MDRPSLYRDIVESSADGIWVTDLEGNTLYANSAFADLYGLPADEMPTVTVFDTLDETGRVQYAEHLRRVRGGEANEEDVEVLFHDRHGRPTWILLRESVLRSEGAAIAILNRISSYEHRRRVLDDLRASRQALEEAQTLARLGSWAFDVATDELELLGGAALPLPFESSASGLSNLLSLIHPVDATTVARVASEALEVGGEFDVDLRLASGSGWVHLRVRGVVHTADDGAPTRVTGTHQDVTEMREVEIALRDEITQSALMRRVAAAANAAQTLREVLGIVRPLLARHDDWIRSAAFWVDETGALEPIDQDPLPQDEALCRTVLATGAPTWSDDGCTVGFSVGTDDRVYAVGTISAAEPPTRRTAVEVMVESVAVQLARVAEREENSRALATARDAAMAASQQKSDFLATMSHEIRTPLNGIIGLTDLLQRSALDAEQHRLASGMQVASHTLLTVLNDVLDFSKLDGRHLQLEHVDVHVRSLVDQVVGVLSGAARQGGVDLAVWCEPTVPPLVLGDPTRISQVLMNLVSNAVKFSAGGEVLIRVSAVEGDAERARLRFDVVDTGIGVDPDQLARLFEPFTQADSSTTRRFGGSGLGLSIAREIVNALGGEISHEPNPRGGSIFSFAVWCERHGIADDDLDDYARTWLSGRRVLVADGSDHRAPALIEQLRWWQVAVTAAPDVARASELLALSIAVGEPFDAVLIDERLAGGGGTTLVSAIAEDTSYDEVAMIVLGSDPEVDATQLREAGVSVYLERPVAAETLRGTLLEQLVGVPHQPTRGTDPIPHPADRPRILVVEDNVVNQIVATGLLTSLGYSSEVAHHGAEALTILAQRHFEAVLMDVQMPVLDGYTATRTLREREAGTARVPVIAMTAAAVEGERERCLAAGMDDFLTKPIDRAGLAEALGRWTSTRREPMNASPPDPLPATGPIEGLDTARLDMLRDLDPGETTYIDRAIGNFQKNSVAAEESIDAHVVAGDAPALKATAHKIAGSALNLGVARAGEAARAMEHLADSGSTDGAEDLLSELHEAMGQARSLLLAYQATYSS